MGTRNMGTPIRHCADVAVDVREDGMCLQKSRYTSMSVTPAVALLAALEEFQKRGGGTAYLVYEKGAEELEVRDASRDGELEEEEDDPADADAEDFPAPMRAENMMRLLAADDDVEAQVGREMFWLRQDVQEAVFDVSPTIWWGLRSSALDGVAASAERDQLVESIVLRRMRDLGYIGVRMAGELVLDRPDKDGRVTPDKDGRVTRMPGKPDSDEGMISYTVARGKVVEFWPEAWASAEVRRNALIP